MILHKIGQHSFSLIELLLVFSILFILVSLTQPMLKSAVEYSQRVHCSSKIGQFSKITHIYAEDNDGFIFPTRNRKVTLAINTKEMISIKGYELTVPSSSNPHGVMPNEKIMSCPSIDKPMLYSSQYNSYNINYNYMGGILTWRNPWGNFPSKSPNQIYHSSPRWTLISDLAFRTKGEWVSPPHSRGKKQAPEGGNVGTLDGAVQWVEFSEWIYIHTWWPGYRNLWTYSEELGTYKPPQNAYGPHAENFN